MTLEMTIDFKVTHKRTDIDIADTMPAKNIAHWPSFGKNVQREYHNPQSYRYIATFNIDVTGALYSLDNNL